MEKIENYTPGPWIAEYDDNGFYYITADNSSVSPYIVATGGECMDDEANIKLIALAPVLYEQHLKMLEVLNRISNCNDLSTAQEYAMDFVKKIYL